MFEFLMKLNFGQWFCVQRKNKKLTQGQIAAALGIKPQTVSGWERNIASPALNPSQTVGLCDLLGVDIAQLKSAFEKGTETD